GTARQIDGRICVAMYHPAAGLHQASLADIIRADFRKLPAFIEHARIVSQPPEEDLEEPLAAAEEARAQVIHEPQTATVLETDLAPAPAVAATSEELEFDDNLPSDTLAPDLPEDAPTETAEQPDEHGENDDFKQLSFF
ncbi:MAG: hypothetical protein ACJ78Q_06155, partial [Chloroflexia bacterium]